MEKKQKKYKPVVLVILDGWGEWENRKGNPFFQAKLPTVNKLDSFYPKTKLQASGIAVGLHWGEVGNSEVGHQTIGTGQVICQLLPTINAQIKSGTFFKNEIILNAFKYAKENNSKIHLMGLVSDGGVHSHLDHLFALIDFAKKSEVKDLYIHAFTDGRDTAPKSAKKYIVKLREVLKRAGVGKIATLSGRYFAMDRNDNWDRTEKTFSAMTKGDGKHEKDPLEAIDYQYKKEVTDEYLRPVNIIEENDKPIGLVEDNDVVIFFNFRKDRARQITKAFSLKEFNHFKDSKRPKNIKFICFTEYEKNLPVDVLFSPQKITTRMGEIISNQKMKQLRIAETEKYAHVTYFFNGGKEKPFAGEDRIMIPSKNHASYAEIPEMSANEVTDKLVSLVDEDKYDFILVNYANSDMVGHTGNFEAGVKCLEIMDKCLERLVKKVLTKKGCLLITADHGNIEEMLDTRTGEIDTKHSVNPVPCWLVTPDNHRKKPGKKISEIGVEGILIDVTATTLDLLGIERPKEINGESLLKLFSEKE